MTKRSQNSRTKAHLIGNVEKIMVLGYAITELQQMQAIQRAKKCLTPHTLKVGNNNLLLPNYPISSKPRQNAEKEQ